MTVIDDGRLTTIALFISDHPRAFAFKANVVVIDDRAVGLAVAVAASALTFFFFVSTAD